MAGRSMRNTRRIAGRGDDERIWRERENRALASGFSYKPVKPLKPYLEARQCTNCGTSFSNEHRIIGRPASFCSPLCRKIHWERKMAVITREAPAFCVCGIQLLPRHGPGPQSRYCSRNCYHRTFHHRRLKLYREPSQPLKHTCLHCGVAFHSYQPNAKWCSQACRSSQMPRVPHFRGPFTCHKCRREYLTRSRGGGEGEKYCSRECYFGRPEVRRKPQRVKERGLNPYEIFQRDAWRCRLCGKETPRTLRGTTDPRAPEQDHIVPLSLGGIHAPSNLQCLCRACNSSKSNSTLAVNS